MSDKLKKFIQGAKSKFDMQEPEQDLFNQIMKKLDSKKAIPVKNKNSPSSIFKWLAIAASFALLVLCNLFYILNEEYYMDSAQKMATILPEESSAIAKTNLINIEDTASQNTIYAENNQLSISNISRLKSSKSRISNVKSIQVNDVQFIDLLDLTNKPVESLTMGKGSLKFQSEICIKIIEGIAASFGNRFNEKQDNPKQIEMETAYISPKNSIVDNPLESLSNTNIFPDTHPEQGAINEEIESEQDYSLKSVIKRVFFSFLSRKAKKWSGNTLTIENSGSNKEVLAVHLKTERLEFSREFKLKNIAD